MNNRLAQYVIFFLLIFCSATNAFPQQKQLINIPGLPSKEIYDLYTDRKGFLWISHNAGISKYDGISFTTFASPQQSSLSTTGIIEDRFGRIWFNNFTGQILYIENGHMAKLDAYQSANEDVFPRVVLLNDLLVATTKKGLFICDTRTLKCHYEMCADRRAKGTSTLTIANNRVIAYGSGLWYSYEPGRGLKLINLNTDIHSDIQKNSTAFCTRSFRDTMFFFANPANVVFKILYVEGKLKMCEKKQYNSFINTITVLKDRYWVNTTNSSVTFVNGKNLSVSGYNLSCATVDKEGHNWYGSVQQGLFTDTGRQDLLGKSYVFSFKNGDIIRCITPCGKKLFLGTQNGDVFTFDPGNNSTVLLTVLHNKFGGISYIQKIGNDRLVICTAVNTYLYNIVTHQIRQIEFVNATRQTIAVGNAMAFAGAKGLVVLPDKATCKDGFARWELKFKKDFSGFNNDLYQGEPMLLVRKRCRAVCYAEHTRTIWASFKDGLYSINSRGMLPFYYQHRAVYVACLAAYNVNVIAGTFNDGILILSGQGVRHLTTENGLISNSIQQVKVVNDDLWVFAGGSLQIFDLKTLKLSDKYAFPGNNDAVVHDACEFDRQCFLSTDKGLCKLPPENRAASGLNIYLTSLLLNGRDTGNINNLVLPHTLNDVQINVGTPYLFNARDILIKYRLKVNDSSPWSYSRPGERSFHLASLMPGRYTFEAMAIKPQTGLSSQPLAVSFRLLPPWWQRWWAVGAWILIIAGVIFVLSRRHYLNVLREQRIEYEKELAVQEERHRISSEIHDDIGAGLSALKLYTSYQDEGKRQKERITDMVSDLSAKIREVIWSLNTENDMIEDLLFFIQANCRKQFEFTAIDLQVNIPDHIPDIMLSGFVRRNIYLIVKEAGQNIIKHSQATRAELSFDISAKHLTINISDDGVGFDHEKIRDHTFNATGMGMRNIKERAAGIGGRLTIRSENGTNISLKVPLKEV
ncbi:MAG TPA: ATP-binding protein [Mucilaginibacter sp.]|nr:ATP-binding protein [Mucilaginibacter sp.]